MTQHEIITASIRRQELIENCHAGVDPDFDLGFDPVLDDLEREFAEFRMQFAA